MRVTTMSVDDRSMTVALAVQQADRPPDRLRLSVDRGDRTDESDLDVTWTSYGPPGRVIWLAKERLTDLDPGRQVLLQVRERADSEEVLGWATAHTLPSAPGASLTLVLGSCFDLANVEASASVGDLYEELLARRGPDGGPTFNLWSGDQVYVDAPWRQGWGVPDAGSIMADKYAGSWGLTDQRSGLAEAMQRSGNWYLPDDHELWNGYPQPSFGTLPLHAVGRMAVQTWRKIRNRLTGSSSSPHPSTQGSWGRAAGEAFCRFQTDQTFDVFDENVSPPQVQVLETADACVVLADSRWFRTIRKTGSSAGFMRGRDLDRLVALTENEQRLLVLVVSRPMVDKLPHRGWFRAKIEYGPEDFSRQYTTLWRALAARAAAELPTIVVGGDVHHHSLRTALDDRLVEVISSPLALLDSLGESTPIGRAMRVWPEIKERLTAAIGRTNSDERSTDPRYPVIGPGKWDGTSARGSSWFEADGLQSGVASLTLSFGPVADGDAPSVQATYRVVVLDDHDPDTFDVHERTMHFDHGWNVADHTPDPLASGYVGSRDP